jgi:hypothetical protein
MEIDIRTDSPKPSDNESEAFGQSVRSLRTFLGVLTIVFRVVYSGTFKRVGKKKKLLNSRPAAFC